LFLFQKKLVLLVREKIQLVIQHHKRVRECFQKVLGHSQRGFKPAGSPASSPCGSIKTIGFYQEKFGGALLEFLGYKETNIIFNQFNHIGRKI
jgi:hypothetical protein